MNQLLIPFVETARAGLAAAGTAGLKSIEGLERVAGLNVALGRRITETVSRDLDTLLAARAPDEVTEAMSSLVQEVPSAWADYARALQDVMVQTAGAAAEAMRPAGGAGAGQTADLFAAGSAFDPSRWAGAFDPTNWARQGGAMFSPAMFTPAGFAPEMARMFGLAPQPRAAA